MSLASAELANLLGRFDKNAHRKGEVSLEPILTVLERLGRPQDRFPPVIHIAGTNGKGSTAAFVRSIAEAAGLTVHVSTSPHLVRVNERIRLAGSLIEDAYFLDCAKRAAAASEGITVSYFELTFAAACLAFAETPADLLVLEVGLGGRLDASNVVDQPAVSVIAPIAFDHQAILGRGLSTIAWKKAGIIKLDCPVVSARQASEAAAVIAEEAFALGAPLSVVTPADIEAVPENLALAGAHQRANFALAAKAVSIWRGEVIPREFLEAGARDVIWPARMQKLRPGPIVERCGRSEVWLDGGHNPHAAEAIADLLSSMPGRKALIVAMMVGKDSDGFFEAFSGLDCTVLTCPNSVAQNSAMPDDLAQTARDKGLSAEAFDSLEVALQAIGQSSFGQVLICGSLHLAGTVLEMNNQRPD